MKMTDEKKIYRILLDLVEPSKMSPAELGKKIQDEYEANPPTLIELMRAHIHTFRLNLNRKK